MGGSIGTSTNHVGKRALDSSCEFFYSNPNDTVLNTKFWDNTNVLRSPEGNPTIECVYLFVSTFNAVIGKSQPLVHSFIVIKCFDDNAFYITDKTKGGIHFKLSYASLREATEEGRTDVREIKRKEVPRD